ncbi:MAG TPA: Imm41 family immunity protein [Ureibacillus sp.]|nr:Imm41 family immunity protein [Ureibacillus sp.]
MNSAIEVLKSNYEGKEGSFIYSLHEECKFEKSAFWDYYNSIVDLTKDTLSQDSLDREISLMLSKTYAFIMRSLLWHFHPKDLYKVKGVPKNKLHLYIERLEIAYLGYFKGDVFKEELHDEDLINPSYRKNR